MKGSFLRSNGAIFSSDPDGWKETDNGNGKYAGAAGDTWSETNNLRVLPRSAGEGHLRHTRAWKGGRQVE